MRAQHPVTIYGTRRTAFRLGKLVVLLVTRLGTMLSFLTQPGRTLRVLVHVVRSAWLRRLARMSTL
jgi:hypothetical protein